MRRRLLDQKGIPKSKRKRFVQQIRVRIWADMLDHARTNFTELPLTISQKTRGLY